MRMKKFLAGLPIIVVSVLLIGAVAGPGAPPPPLPPPPLPPASSGAVGPVGIVDEVFAYPGFTHGQVLRVSESGWEKGFLAVTFTEPGLPYSLYPVWAINPSWVSDWTNPITVIFQETVSVGGRRGSLAEILPGDIANVRGEIRYGTFWITHIEVTQILWVPSS